MGGLCSKKLNAHSNSRPLSNANFNDYDNRNKKDGIVTSTSHVTEKQLQEPKQTKEPYSYPTCNSIGNDFYDGIPLYPSLKSRSVRSSSKQAAVAKVSITISFFYHLVFGYFTYLVLHNLNGMLSMFMSCSLYILLCKTSSWFLCHVVYIIKIKY